MACTIIGEATPEFKKTEALIVAQHPVYIKAKREAEAWWQDIFGDDDLSEAFEK